MVREFPFLPQSRGESPGLSVLVIAPCLCLRDRGDLVQKYMYLDRASQMLVHRSPKNLASAGSDSMGLGQACESVFVTSSLVMLRLLVHGPW